MKGDGWKVLTPQERSARNQRGWQTRRAQGWTSPLKDGRSRQKRKLMDQLGLSSEEADAQLVKTVCDACLRPFGDETPHVDHYHTTNQFRGMLHLQCNVALGMLGDSAEALNNAANYLSRRAMTRDDDYLSHLNSIAQEDVAGLKKAQESYGDSWKKRGGVGAYMMLVRKMDRMELQAKKHGYDVFAAIEADPRAEGLIDDIRDLRRYLMLVESEMRARASQAACSQHRDNLAGETGE